MQVFVQLIAMWHFGLIALATIGLFGGGYLANRKLRQFWAWAKNSEAPKERVVVFLPLNLLVGLLIGGFVQTVYEAGSMCSQYQRPLVPCTLHVLTRA